MLLPMQNIKKYFTGFSWDGKAAALGLCFGLVAKVSRQHTNALAVAEWFLHSVKVFLLLMLP